MKKTFALVLAIAVLFTFTACGSSTTKTGLATITSIGSSKDLTAEKDGTAQADTIIASVTVDSAGKLVTVDIESVQAKINFDKDGKVTSDKAVKVPSKTELGEKYGMKKASKIGMEWNEQIAGLEQWLVGKTADQITNMKVKEVEGKKIADEADLMTKVTIGIADYQEVVLKAMASAK